jgi:ketosteroid isomerase-like protein
VVSSSGDLGFTSGPWQYKEPGDGTSPPATGWFFTAWRKQPDGSFKVEADLGVSAPLNYAAPGDVVDASPASTGAPAPRPSSAANARVAIVHAERLLARAAASGLGAAVLAVAEPSVRVYRDGVLPATDADGARKLLTADTRQADCVFARVVASASGDLGYAYGTCTSSKKDKKFGYLRVWHRQADGNWSVLVDVTP